MGRCPSTQALRPRPGPSARRPKRETHRERVLARAAQRASEWDRATAAEGWPASSSEASPAAQSARVGSSRALGPRTGRRDWLPPRFGARPPPGPAQTGTCQQRRGSEPGLSGRTGGATESSVPCRLPPLTCGWGAAPASPFLGGRLLALGGVLGGRRGQRPRFLAAWNMREKSLQHFPNEHWKASRRSGGGGRKGEGGGWRGEGGRGRAVGEGHALDAEAPGARAPWSPACCGRDTLGRPHSPRPRPDTSSREAPVPECPFLPDSNSLSRSPP